jgi:hypothetical protein
MKLVEAWQTEDGMLFDNIYQASDHEAKYKFTKYVNENNIQMPKKTLTI